MTEAERYADAWDIGFKTALLNLFGDSGHGRVRNPFDPEKPCPCGDDHGERETSSPR